MTVVDRFVQAVAHGGAMRPTLQVIHSAETPLRAGYAKSIAENWFGSKTSGVGTSAHFMVDPVELIRMLSDNVVSYAVGPKANGFTLNWEQAGYARFTRAEWTTPEAGIPQMNRLAAGVRERGLANGIPLRWASDDDIRAAARGVPGGICFHDDIRRVLGGTTHTDPMPNYPRDLLMARIQGAAAPTGDDMNEWQDAVLMETNKLVKDAVAALREPVASVIDPKIKLAPRDMLASIDGATWTSLNRTLPAMQVELSGLRVAVNTLAEAAAKGGGASAEAIKKAVSDAIEEGVVKVEVAVHGRQAD